MASIRIIFHQSPSIRPSTGKRGELSLATHRAQPHPRQPRYQLQNVWLSPLRNTIVHNSTVLQNTGFYHYVCKAVTLSSQCHLYKHYVLHTWYDFFFFRARESRELARKRSAPRELQATTELRYPSGRPAISSRYCTATVAVPFSTFRRYPLDTARQLWQYRSVRNRSSPRNQTLHQDDRTPQLTPLMGPNSSATSNPYSQCRMKNEVT